MGLRGPEEMSMRCDFGSGSGRDDFHFVDLNYNTCTSDLDRMVKNAKESDNDTLFQTNP